MALFSANAPEPPGGKGSARFCDPILRFPALRRQFGSNQCARIAKSKSATMLVILMAGLTAGPAVSL